MTEKQVQDALLSHLSTQLAGAYPTFTTAYALERAGQLYQAGTPFIVCTPRSAEYEWPGEDKWEFLVQFSKSEARDPNKTAKVSIEADRDLIVAVQTAINSDAGYITLKGAGLYKSTLRALGEDQRDMTLINPHVFSCSTF